MGDCPGLLPRSHQVQVGQRQGGQHPEDRHIRRPRHQDCLHRWMARVCRPVAHRSNIWLLAMTPNGSCWVMLKSIAGGGGVTLLAAEAPSSNRECPLPRPSLEASLSP